MSLLDRREELRERDERGFLAELAALPRAYDGPDGRQPGPYGLTGFGEAAAVYGLVEPWMDGPVVVQGTQFLLAGGFDFGAIGPLQVQAEAAGSKPLVLGPADPQPSWGATQGPLATYHYVGYLAHAVGRGDGFAEVQDTLAGLAEALGPDRPTEENPAKELAWALWERVPLLVTARPRQGWQPLLQQMFARVGRSLAIPSGPHPGGTLSGALEGRKALGDVLVGLVVGADDEESRLARELLETRVPQVETLAFPLAGVGAPSDGVLEGLALWYAAAWMAAYLALLHEQAPGESDLYRKVASVAEGATGEEGAEA